MSRRPEQKAKPPRATTLPIAEDGPWYEDGLRFRCTCCGNCCTGPPGYVWVTDEEIERLADHLELSVDEVRTKYVRKVGNRQSFKEVRSPKGEYDCIFLKPLPGDDPQRSGKHRKRGCSIYTVRPLQCRTWPFWHGLLESPEAWQHSKRTCPGMDDPKAKLYGVKEIEALRDAEDWPEEAPSSK